MKHEKEHAMRQGTQRDIPEIQEHEVSIFRSAKNYRAMEFYENDED